MISAGVDFSVGSVFKTMPSAPLVSRLPKIWPAVASGLLVLACFPPFRLALIVFVALVPWLLYLRECDGKHAFRSGVLFGVVFWLGELSFIAGFVTKWTGSWMMGAIPYLLGCFVACFYFALFGWVANVCYRRSLIWAVPVVWAGVEVFRSYVIQLAFPYGLLAMPLTSAPAIIQSAHYGSVFLVSAWVVLANVIVSELMAGKRYLDLRWYGAVFVFVLIVSVVRFGNEPSGQIRHVVAGQPGVNLAYGDKDQQRTSLGRSVDEIIARAAGADLLVLPEGIARCNDGPPPVMDFHVRPDVPTVFGAQRGRDPIYQSAFSYDGHWDYADKTRLVIFGEYVPLRQILPAGFNLPAGDLTPARELKNVHAGALTVGAALCFEALFPDVTYGHARDGANILAVMSVDDWYLGTNAPEQLRDFSNWRAIETGLPVVRAASLGYTIIVDQRGRTVASAPIGGQEVISAAVKVPDRADLFPLFLVFPYVSVLSLILIPGYDFLLLRRGS